MRTIFLLLLAGTCSVCHVNAQTTGTLTDSRDGKVYKTVEIGDQWWMAENLAYLPSVNPGTVGSETEPCFYVYGYNGTDVAAAKATINYSSYGVLYNWPAAMNGATSSSSNPSGVPGICPTGWHLPSDAEWTVLSDYLINHGYGYEGSGDDIGKSMATTTDWTSITYPGYVGWNQGTNNSSGFSGLPGGYLWSRYHSFENIKLAGFWWSTTGSLTTTAKVQYLGYNNEDFATLERDKTDGYSVRCVKKYTDTLSLQLKTGWNLLSVNVIPDSSDMKVLFRPLIGNGLLVKIQDGSGSALEDFGVFGGWVNNIGNIAPTAGYKIKVNNPCQIEIFGRRVILPVDIPLKAGWNIMGYPQSIESDGKRVVEPLITRKTLVKVQDETGNAIEDYGIFGGWTNNIGNFKPGEGYKIKSTTDEILTLSSVIPSVITGMPDSITSHTVVLGGNVTSAGGSEVSERGICYAAHNTPVIENNKIVVGSGNGPFKVKITGLDANSVYYVRAYAINIQGIAYGDQVVFTTLTPPPVVITNPVTNVTAATVTCGGSITSDYEAITTRGVCWNTTGNPTIADSKTSNGLGTGSFTSNLSGLAANTTYYVRAYATKNQGIAYGNQITFSTLAIVTTNAISNISVFTATSGGNITSAGTTAITARGVCWNTSGSPTIADPKTSNGEGTGSFTSDLTTLAANTTYYVRAYATNFQGPAYGNQVQFTTLLVIPTVTTNPVTAIMETTATCGGNVTDAGDAAVTARGVCWNTTGSPTITDSKTYSGQGTGVFDSYLSGLAVNTFYYVRAYATNIYGTAYGNQVKFNTPLFPTVTTDEVSNIFDHTARCGGEVLDKGNTPVSVCGVCWSTEPNPDINDNKTEMDLTCIWNPNTGAVSCYISGDLTNLAANTMYYVRAYATNITGTGYGNQVSFTTLPEIMPPIVITGPVTGITQRTAISGGNVTGEGSLPVKARGVCWSPNPDNVTYGNSVSTHDGSGLGSFTSNLSGLQPNKTYYLRAYATNGKIAYGELVSFTTLALGPPTLTTNQVTDITQTTATSGGSVTNDGGETVTARGVCWNTTGNPTIAGNKTQDGTGTGSFISYLTGLTAGTTYYLRAFATNSLGTGYGGLQTFTTPNETGTFVDSRDGKIYNWVKIGGQTWMSHNLFWLPSVSPSSTGSSTSPLYYVYGYQGTDPLMAKVTTQYKTYGVLYNWPAAKTACPAGWHLPTETEWNTLANYLGGLTVAGGKMKVVGTTYWFSPNTGATNSEGFNGLPGGGRNTVGGVFSNLHENAFFWSATGYSTTSAICGSLSYNNRELTPSALSKASGFSVRCLKD